MVAAGELMRNGRHRSSVSRSYFAAYAAVSWVLARQGVNFEGDQVGPSHRNVQPLIVNNVAGLGKKKKAKMKAALNRLYENRLDADYRPAWHVGKDTAMDSVSLASFVLGSLGVEI
jgi:uncharacterized protein (UPF0332 family)